MKRDHAFGIAILVVFALIASGYLWLAVPAHAQMPPDNSSTQIVTPPTPSPADGAGTTGRPQAVTTTTTFNAAQAKFAYDITILSIVIAAVIIAAFCAMYAWGKALNDFSRHYIVIVVIVSAIFLIVMGYSEQQVAPAFGLLGTVLGYIFGRAATQNGPPPAGTPGGEPVEYAQRDLPRDKPAAVEAAE